ncbi:hypothetical protein AKJ16_DCAP05674 [Drosera capensis]
MSHGIHACIKPVTLVLLLLNARPIVHMVDNPHILWFRNSNLGQIQWAAPVHWPPPTPTHQPSHIYTTTILSPSTGERKTLTLAALHLPDLDPSFN